MVRIDDELGAAAGGDVFATRSVAGFATAIAGQAGIFKMHPRVGTGGEFLDDLLMTVGAGLVADVVGVGNLQRNKSGAGDGSAGDEKQGGRDADHQGNYQ